MNIGEKSIELHRKLQGKIEITSKYDVKNKEDLSLVYTPGVAAVCLKIQENPEESYELTSKNSTVAVISDGSAVLGLGNIGPLAAMPVMEGKSMLFKHFANIDSVPIVLGVHTVDEIVAVVKAIAPSFGGINLEDIAAPKCFEIEDRLKAELDIPVMHDDQHGTAIISSAALLNALELAEKDIKKVKIVISGAGASAMSCAKLYCSLGAKLENIYMFDSKGLLSKEVLKCTSKVRHCPIFFSKSRPLFWDMQRNYDVRAKSV
jgi:malic enzyme